MKKIRLFSLLLSLGSVATAVTAQDMPGKDLIERGHYLAIAADCAACHTAAPAGKPFAGGYAISSPMGKIISTNITPSKTFGIGSWTEAQFTRAVREGVSPHGNLYPAMPYTAYSGISDQDMHALWAYFSQDVQPVDEAPKEKTTLEFPFNIRMVMKGWNLLYSGPSPTKDTETQASEMQRGEYLVNALEHCSTCHTPRNVMMAEKPSQYLSGAFVGGWYAPNITSDKDTGIGGWSNQQIVDYLRSGHVKNKAQAAGPMAEAVEHSLRKLSNDDLQAIATYLKQVPPIATPEMSHRPGTQPVNAEPATALDYPINREPAAMAEGESVDGRRIYMSACASCHQPNGKGTDDQFYPSLTENSVVGDGQSANLIMAITQGVQRKTNDYEVSMPAFHDELNDQQTAAVANYVLQQFGHSTQKVTAEEVAKLKNGGEQPFIVKYLHALLIAGLIIAVLVIWGLSKLFRQRK